MHGWEKKIEILYNLADIRLQDGVEYADFLFEK
jgi:hypothetical protein